MALNDIFTMIKADKYTQDGREELIKAQQAETEDKTYKPGEISETTGKQKQPDGSWKFPKQAGGKNAEKKDGLTNAEGKLSERGKLAYQEHAKKISNESLESLIRNKDKAYVKHNDEIAEIYKEELKRRNASKPDLKKEDARKQLLELEKQRRSYKDDTVENYAGHNIRLKQASLLRQAGFNGRADFDNYLKEKMPNDSAPRVLTGDSKIRIRK